MRLAVPTLAAVLALAVLRSGTAEANPAVIAMKAAQAASRAAQAARGAMRAASKMSRMRKLMQRARKGQSAMKSFGSLNRTRDRVSRSLAKHRMERLRTSSRMHLDRARTRISHAPMKIRHNVSTFAKRQLQSRSFAQQLQRRNLQQRMLDMHRNHQRRSSAQRNNSAAEQQRSRMRRNASSSSRGVLASAMAR